MGIGTSIFLIAVGAILKYAVTAHVSDIEVNVVGVILMVVGVVGLLQSMLWMTIWADRQRGVVDEGAVVRDRVVERDVV